MHCIGPVRRDPPSPTLRDRSFYCRRPDRSPSSARLQRAEHGFQVRQQHTFPPNSSSSQSLMLGAQAKAASKADSGKVASYRVCGRCWRTAAHEWDSSSRLVAGIAVAEGRAGLPPRVSGDSASDSGMECLGPRIRYSGRSPSVFAVRWFNECCACSGVFTLRVKLGRYLGRRLGCLSAPRRNYASELPTRS